jgi:hypothetical protein
VLIKEERARALHRKDYMWVHLKASISFEAESHDATQICRAAAEILWADAISIPPHLTARFRDAAPAWKRKSRTLKEKLGRTSRILEATLAVLQVRVAFGLATDKTAGRGVGEKVFRRPPTPPRDT